MNRKLRYTLILISFLITLGTAWHMWQLTVQMGLWSYFPLLLFLFGWLTIVFIWEPRFSKHPQKLKLMGLATLSGVLLALGFPPFPLTFLMFIAFVPLLMVEQAIADQQAGPAKWEVFKYSYHAFVIWNVLATYWVANTAFVAGFVAMMLNSFFMTIPFVLFHQTKKMMNKQMAWFAFVAYWCSFEYIHLYWEISWPWLTLGNSFASFPTWIQWYEYTGVFGGTLWILLANILLFKIVNTYQENKKFEFQAITKTATLILLPIAISLAIYFNYENKGRAIDVVVLQPNFEPHYEKFHESEKNILKRFTELSRSALSKETDYLVFPETSFGGVNVRNILTSQRSMREIKKMVDEYPNLKLISGVGARKIYKDGEAFSPALRTHVRAPGDTIFWEAYNAAIQMTAGSQDADLYLKSKFVPGAEFLPYRNIFFFLKPLIDKLGGTLAGFGTQPERSVFKSADGTAIAPVICYESIYGGYSSNYVKKGANAMFVVTNDGWWDNTAGHQQHLAYSSLLAIETRRGIARSANTGISGFINQRGDLSLATKYGETAAVRGSIQLNDDITFFVRWGDLIGRVSLFITIILLLNTFVKGKIASREKMVE